MARIQVFEDHLSVDLEVPIEQLLIVSKILEQIMKDIVDLAQHGVTGDISARVTRGGKE